MPKSTVVPTNYGLNSVSSMVVAWKKLPWGELALLYSLLMPIPDCSPSSITAARVSYFLLCAHRRPAQKYRGFVALHVRFDGSDHD